MDEKFDTWHYCLAGISIVLLLVVLYFIFFKQPSQDQFDPVPQKRRVDAQTGHQESPAMPPEPTGDVTQVEDVEPQQPALVLFWATWCPHCKEVIKFWPELAKALSGKIKVTEFESAVHDKRRFPVKGYPTIKLFPMGLSKPEVSMEYSGPRNPQAILNFISVQFSRS